ncbi:MAG: 6,7-dimethyl-8-ribityllumazine synthase [bacterium]
MQRKNKIIKKSINGSKLKIAIVVSEFNRDITGSLLKGALETLRSNKVKDNNIKIIWVPGSFEIPLACQKLATSKKFDGLIALGCVIKGETDHYYYIAGEASRGVMDVILKFNIPIGFGIITTNNLKQAQARCHGKSNKGREAALAVLEMIN